MRLAVFVLFLRRLILRIARKGEISIRQTPVRYIDLDIWTFQTYNIGQRDEIVLFLCIIYYLKDWNVIEVECSGNFAHYCCIYLVFVCKALQGYISINVIIFHAKKINHIIQTFQCFPRIARILYSKRDSVTRLSEWEFFFPVNHSTGSKRYSDVILSGSRSLTSNFDYYRWRRVWLTIAKKLF
jgi:hypothetical protein